jgi:Flp pilus assembly protein TadG
VAAVEFAFVAPFLIVLLTGVVELGLAIRAEILAEEAAAAGAQSALGGYVAADVEAAVESASPAMTITASPAPAEFYACPSTSGLTRTTQSATCADGRAARHFVDVWATVARPTVLGSGFGLPSTLTAHATARAP